MLASTPGCLRRPCATVLLFSRRHPGKPLLALAVCPGLFGRGRRTVEGRGRILFIIRGGAGAMRVDGSTPSPEAALFVVPAMTDGQPRALKRAQAAMSTAKCPVEKTLLLP